MFRDPLPVELSHPLYLLLEVDVHSVVYDLHLQVRQVVLALIDLHLYVRKLILNVRDDILSFFQLLFQAH